MRRKRTRTRDRKHPSHRGGHPVETFPQRPFVFFSDVEGNADGNRFGYPGNSTVMKIAGDVKPALNYLKDLLTQFDEQQYTYVHGGDTLEFSRSGPLHEPNESNKQEFGGLFAVQKLLDIKCKNILGNRDINKLWLPFSLVIIGSARATHIDLAGWWYYDAYAPLKGYESLETTLDTLLKNIYGATEGGAKQPVCNGFDNYRYKMPPLSVKEKDFPKMLTQIKELYNEDLESEAMLFLKHLMCESGVIYKWIQAGHICLAFEGSNCNYVFAHGSLPIHEISYYDTIFNTGFNEYHRILKNGYSTQECRTFMSNARQHHTGNGDGKTLQAFLNLSISHRGYPKNPQEEAFSPVNTSFVTNVNGRKENVANFLNANTDFKLKPLIVMHGHRNFSFYTPLKCECFEHNTTVVYCDTSSWREANPQTRPTCIVAHQDGKTVVYSPYVPKDGQLLADYSTILTEENRMLTLNGQQFNRGTLFSPFTK